MPNDPPHAVRRWLQTIAAWSQAFRVDDTTEFQAEPDYAPWDEEFVIRPEGQQRRIHVVVGMKHRLHPRHVQDVAGRINGSRSMAEPGTIWAIAAPFVSSRAAELCRRHGVGYFDAAGNCHLAGDGFYLHIEGHPNPRPDTRRAENLFAPKSSRVVRVLLEDPSRAWRAADLAKEAKVSLGLTSKVRHGLLEQAFAEETEGGLRVRDPQGLLKAWAAAYVPTARAVSVFSLDPADRLERRVIEWGERRSVRCALAEFSGAAKVAPMVRHKRAAFYILERGPRDVLRSLSAELDLKEVDSGPSAVLWVTSDDSVFYNASSRGGLTVVSPVQLYLDLMKNPARGREAAEEVAARLFKSWPRQDAEAAP